MVYPCGQICLQPVNFFGAELAETLHHQTNETDRNAGTENAAREPVWVEPCGTTLYDVAIIKTSPGEGT
jgi:hypothetical protein